MKKNLKYLRESRRLKERQRVLENFYTKQIKKGKTFRADIFDKISMIIGVLIALIFIFNKIIGNFIISLLLGLISTTIIGIFGKRLNKKIRDKKIQDIRKEYKLKLQEEKVLLPDEDIEDYIISRYYEKKSELKSSLNFFSKDKIFKLYLLFIVFYITAFFSTYPMYYKIMAVVTFVIATIISSYNFTEYLRKKDNKDLLNKDIDV